MNTFLALVCMASILGLVTSAGSAEPDTHNDGKPYPDPKRFEKDIQRFEEADKKNPPPEGAIVGVGSSSMKGWHATIHDDLAPLTIIPRGFGGSNMNEALYYIDRIVLAYKPRAILVYEGDNDVAQGVTPRKIAATFAAFVAKVHAQLPKTRIYFLAIKPSIRRWHMWPTMVEANRLVADRCAKDDRLFYVDVATGMLGEDGTPRKDIFQKDNLHMTRPGYEIWRDAARPVLLQQELRFEEATDQP